MQLKAQEKAREPSLSDASSPAPSQYPAQEDSSDFTAAEWELDRAAVRRLDYTVLPLAAIAYLLNFLDRSNLGNAKVAGLAKDLHLTSHQYLICVTCTYVLYIVFEMPANLLLKKIGAHIAIPAMITAWGTVCCLTGLVQNYHGLVAARLILGMCEAGLFPGLVLYLSMFYRRHELQTRISLFFSAASLAGAFSGLLAAAIVKLNGKSGQAGWRWIFYLEGLFTALYGIAMFFVFPRSPAHSRFLSPEHKAHIARRLKLDSPAGVDDFEEKFDWKEVRKAATSPHVILLFIALFGNGLTLYGFGYFTPTIVQTFGYSPIKTQLLTVPPFILAFLLTMFNAWWSDRYGRRGLCAILMSLLALAGYISALFTFGRHVAFFLTTLALSVFFKSMAMAVRYTALFLAVSAVYSTAPALVTWLPNNSAGHYRKATAVAFGFISTNSGGIASTWLFPANEGPRYYRASCVLISMTILIVVACSLNLLYLRRENRKKAERRNTGQSSLDAASWAAEGDRHAHFVYSY
ncbi:hypothetical protein JCM10908_002043 [Rhodotorula pacifica]|uniref:uncharacterized protein n=1 Tax=Rhodotorula pacifica TaxID=1495444 RepID=UPI00317498EE